MPRKPSQTLEQFNPALADQLVDQSLRSIARGSDKKVQWRCPVDSRHVWWASPMNRTASENPTGCSVCNGKTVIPGVNDVATTHPKLAAELVDRSLATTLKPGSNTSVLWQCPVDSNHTWKATPYSRTAKKTGCPYCSGRNQRF